MLAACGSLFLLLGAVLCWHCGCTPKTTSTGPALQGQAIRVRLFPLVDQATIRADQPPIYYTTADTTPRQLDLPPNVNVPLTYTGVGWMMGRTNLGGGQLVIRPIVDGSVRVNDKPYRGQYRFVPMGGAKLDVINELDIDDYLKGVLAKEVLVGWHEEAYKAQAIVARTYALYEKLVPRSAPRHWDVWADTRSQVYGGMDAETPKSRDAVNATAGIVLVAGPPGQQKIFKAYFSSCCGGISQSSMHAFNDPYEESLSEQSVGSLCSASPRFTWGPIVITKDELTRRFRLYGAARNGITKDIATLRAIDIELRNRFGRPVRYTLTDSAGHRYSLSGEELRWAVNTDAAPGTGLNSSFLESIVNDTDRIRFLGGHGFGHGVGLCQWCTEARAQAGMRHEDIVTLSYPRARLLRAY
jgi:stage II sporulation protein D